MADGHVLSHPRLGKIYGNDHGSTIQFLGLNYGNLASPFSPPTLHDGQETDIVDATSHGYNSENPSLLYLAMLTSIILLPEGRPHRPLKMQ
jgi:hypothetical protein